MKYVIGIDAGTTNVKSVLFDLEGNELCTESVPNLPYYLPNNEIEQDMDIVWQNVLNSLILLVRRNKINKDDVIGMGVTGQGEGIWLIDEYGKPIQNSYLWSDGRAYKEVEDLLKKENEVLYKDIVKTTGLTAFPGNQLILLMWMHKNQPEVLDKADKMFFCKDWIRFNLTGEVFTDTTDAGTAHLDLSTNQPAKDIYKKLGLEKYLRLIPEIKKPHEIGGYLTQKVADNVGLNAGIPVVMGGIDLVNSMVGMGAVENNDIGIILGTTCGVQVVLEKDKAEFGDSRYENHAIENLTISMNPTMNGMPNIDWSINEISLNKDYKIIDDVIRNIKPGCDGVVYHPYIGAAGERAPFTNVNAKASFFGINQDTTRDSLIKAVYEGMIYAVKDCLLKASDEGEIFISGGGAKSTILPQLIADATGLVVNKSKGYELGAKGAAIMVLIALGYYKDYPEAKAKCCEALDKIYPNKDKKYIYDRYFTLYKKLRLAYNDLWNERREILDDVNKYMTEKGIDK